MVGIKYKLLQQTFCKYNIKLSQFKIKQICVKMLNILIITVLTYFQTFKVYSNNHDAVTLITETEKYTYILLNTKN